MRRVRIRAVPLLLPLLALPAAPAAAQSPASEPAAIAADRALRVTADSATIIVTFTGAGTARLDAETTSGRFALAADSVTLRAWAVAAAQLGPPGRDSGGVPTYAGVALGDATAGTRASLSRLTADPRGDYALHLSAGERGHAVRLRYAEWEALYLALLAEDPVQVAREQEQLRTYFEFQVETPAVADRSNRRPRYPPEMAAARRRGSVIAQVVVGLDGRPMMGTFKVLESTDDAFTDEVRRAVADWRFTPARLQGRPVLQLVQMPFDFTP